MSLTTKKRLKKESLTIKRRTEYFGISGFVMEVTIYLVIEVRLKGH